MSDIQQMLLAFYFNFHTGADSILPCNCLKSLSHIFENAPQGPWRVLVGCSSCKRLVIIPGGFWGAGNSRLFGTNDQTMLKVALIACLDHHHMAAVCSGEGSIHRGVHLQGVAIPVCVYLYCVCLNVHIFQASSSVVMIVGIWLDNSLSVTETHSAFRYPSQQPPGYSLKREKKKLTWGGGQRKSLQSA